MRRVSWLFVFFLTPVSVMYYFNFFYSVENDDTDVQAEKPGQQHHGRTSHKTEPNNRFGETKMLTTGKHAWKVSIFFICCHWLIRHFCDSNYGGSV